MKRIKVFEAFKPTGKDKYDKYLQKLWDEFIEAVKEEESGSEFPRDVDPKQLEEFFDDVQEEIIDSEGKGEEPEVYEVFYYKKSSGPQDAGDKTTFGLYRAYGPKHAELRYGIEYCDIEVIQGGWSTGGIQSDQIDQEYIDEKIQHLSSELEMWQTIK